MMSFLKYMAARDDLGRGGGLRLFTAYQRRSRSPEPLGPELTAEGLVEGNAEEARLPRR